MSGGIGNNTETGHLRGSARCGIDCQIGRHGFCGLIHSLVVMDLATIGDNKANALTAVMGRATTQTDKAVALIFLVHLHPVMHVLVGGVGDRLVKNHILHLSGIKEAGYFLGNTSLGNALVRNNKRFRSTKGLDLLWNLLGCANAN